MAGKVLLHLLRVLWSSLTAILDMCSLAKGEDGAMTMEIGIGQKMGMPIVLVSANLFVSKRVETHQYSAYRTKCVQSSAGRY